MEGEKGQKTRDIVHTANKQVTLWWNKADNKIHFDFEVYDFLMIY